MKREGPSLTHYAQPECVRVYGCVHARVRMYRAPLCPLQKDMLPTYVRTEHPRLRRLADRLRRQSHLVERACLRTYVREDACCLRVCPPSTRMSSSLLASVGSSCSCWICATIAWPCSRSLSKASLTTCLMLSSLDLRRIVLRLRFLFITYTSLRRFCKHIQRRLIGPWRRLIH